MKYLLEIDFFDLRFPTTYLPPSTRRLRTRDLVFALSYTQHLQVFAYFYVYGPVFHVSPELMKRYDYILTY